MRAAQMTAVGSPDVLRPVDLPELQISSPSQIKVRLHAAGVNPIDTKIRSRGLFYGAEPRPSWAATAPARSLKPAMQ